MVNFPKGSIHWRQKVSIDDGEDKKGILGDDDDLDFRTQWYGDNVLPE